MVASRAGALAAFAGAALLLVATIAHPAGADPGDAVEAFAEYARDDLWVWSHAMQFGGVALMGAGFIALICGLRNNLATLARIGVGCTFGLAAALQAVDGVALKVMVDRLAATSTGERSAVFEATYAVRQIEIGLATYLSFVSALTVLSLAGVSLRHLDVPRWFAAVGVVCGLGLAATATAQAAGGFSPTAMALSMPSSIVLLVWVALCGRSLWTGRPVDSQRSP